jgi:hypothetical protein
MWQRPRSRGASAGDCEGEVLNHCSEKNILQPHLFFSLIKIQVIVIILSKTNCYKKSVKGNQPQGCALEGLCSVLELAKRRKESPILFFEPFNHTSMMSGDEGWLQTSCLYCFSFVTERERGRGKGKVRWVDLERQRRAGTFLVFCGVLGKSCGDNARSP